MSALAHLRDCQLLLNPALSIVDAPLVAETINSALGVAAPDGSPTAIGEQAQAYRRASATCEKVAAGLKDAGRNKLPAAWRGAAAETAGDSVMALTAEVETTAQALDGAGRALAAWGENLRSAQQADQAGRAGLQAAKSQLGPLGGFLGGVLAGIEEVTDPVAFATAVTLAREGVASMISGASLAQTSGQATAATLNQLADQARAQRVTGDGLSPLDAVVLANEANAASGGGGDILTPAELTRASRLMNAMTPTERARFEALLADAKSPQEAAFVMKALAAGNLLPAVEQFDALIHPHGNDPEWLSQHLSVDLAGTGNPPGFPSYDGQVWAPPAPGGTAADILAQQSQQDVGDCVSASAVVALASLDPVFMLQLTTGDQPQVAGSDSPQNFVDRLQQAFISQYQAGQRADGDKAVFPNLDKGVGKTGMTLLDNSDLGRATGTQYRPVPLNGSSDNQAVLPQIEKAVDSGRPVPLVIVNNTPDPFTGGTDSMSHAVVIIGQSGDRLEIYDPNGYTNWITTQQFASNQLGTPDVQWSAAGVELPTA